MIDFESMVEDSHNNQYFNRYVRKIDEIMSIKHIIPWELYGINTPFDLTVNELNFEIKIQFCLPDRIALEQFTDHNNKILGWVHKLRENGVDIVLFFYPNTDNYIAVYAQDLYDWWMVNSDKYQIIKNKVTKHNDSIWQSSFSWVYLSDLPKNSIWYSNIDRKEKGLENWYS